MHPIYILLCVLLLALLGYGIYVYTTDGPKKLFGVHHEIPICVSNGSGCQSLILPDDWSNGNARNICLGNTCGPCDKSKLCNNKVVCNNGQVIDNQTAFDSCYDNFAFCRHVNDHGKCTYNSF